MAYPPTRKKTGITWASQVSGYAQRQVGQRGVAGGPAGGVVADHGDAPVAENDHGDGERPEQVDVALPPSRGALGELPQAAHGLRLCQPALAGGDNGSVAEGLKSAPRLS